MDIDSTWAAEELGVVGRDVLADDADDRAARDVAELNERVDDGLGAVDGNGKA
ncbi:hypothetical protein SDC9_164326 [bioreactor metagenome]|uniref:Uncharacterized protein n=1 Tax=bioreactor metagenome TaxID=1076179 RepID=A0A645FRC7_9ZZZZ